MENAEKTKSANHYIHALYSKASRIIQMPRSHLVYFSVCVSQSLSFQFPLHCAGNTHLSIYTHRERK